VLTESGYSVFEASEARKGQRNSCLSTKISASPGKKTLYSIFLPGKAWIQNQKQSFMVICVFH